MRGFHTSPFSFVYLLIAASSPAHAGFLITGFAPEHWSQTDSFLGITGATIEDFEDINLAAGLQISISQSDGSFGPSSVLPRTFDPRWVPNGGDDPLGQIFMSGVWDGSHVLINHKDLLVQGTEYNHFGGGDVTFHFAGGVSLFGVSVQQNNDNADVFINGSHVGVTSDWLVLDGERNGYLRIMATEGSIISDVTIANRQFSNSTIEDGLAFDHLAFIPAASAVPEPASLVLLGLASPGLVWLTRRRSRCAAS